MTKKILIAEDHQDIVKVLGYCFKKEGYEVISAEDGQDAIDKITSFKPDLAILDLRIPVLDGREVARRIKQEDATKDTRILFLSASEDALTPENLKELQAEGLIKKPFDIEFLIQRVKEIIGPSP